MTTSALAILPAGYLSLLTGVALRGRPGAIPESLTWHPRFVVLVPAHDEAPIIESTVRALLGQDYPPDRLAVHVIADNCSDDTATIAAAAGATVHVRTDAVHPGKGAALNWCLDRLAADSFDVVAIVDADTLAESGFVIALARALAGGAAAAQGYYGVAAPATSTSVGLRFVAIACRHHLRPLARTALGASCGLYGNGMAFRREVMEGRRWSSHLVEDAEFQMELLLDGIVVTYVPDARLFAEMPDTLSAATTQNERWELGRLQLIRRFVPTLSRLAVRGGPLARRVYADAVADHLTPPISVVALIDGAAVALGGVALAVRPGRMARWSALGAILSSVVLVVHVLAGLRLVGAPREVYRSLGGAPRAVLWKLALLTRVVRRPDSVAWTRTARNEPAEGPR